MAERSTVARGAGRGIALVARLIAIVTGVIALIIVLGILLVVLEANPDNAIVEFITDLARTLVGPFEELFQLDSMKAQIAVNWGIAALVWFAVGAVIAGLLRRLGGAAAR